MTLYKIRYKGLSDIREMSAEDLKNAGVPGVGGDLRFTRQNLFSVVVDGMPERLRDILDTEGSFVVEEIGDDGHVKAVIIEGGVIDDTAPIVVDSTTGQVSEKGERDPNADPVTSPIAEPTGDESSAVDPALAKVKTTKP